MALQNQRMTGFWKWKSKNEDFYCIYPKAGKRKFLTDSIIKFTRYSIQYLCLLQLGFDIYTRKLVVQYYDRVYVSMDEIVTFICAVENTNPVNVMSSVFTAPLEDGSVNTLFYYNAHLNVFNT